MNDVDMYVHKRQQQQKQLRVIVFICPCNALMQWMLHLVIRRRPVESKKSQQLKMINKLLDKNSFFYGGWVLSCLYDSTCVWAGGRLTLQQQTQKFSSGGIWFCFVFPINFAVEYKSLINVLHLILFFFAFSIGAV